MTDHQLAFQIEGPDAAELAKELEAELARAFPDWPRHIQAVPPRGGRETVKGDTLDFVTLVVSIPSGALAAWDLIVRLKMKEKAERLKEWAARRLGPDSAHRVTWNRPGGAVRLDEARVDEIVNALNEMASPNPSPREPRP